MQKIDRLLEKLEKEAALLQPKSDGGQFPVRELLANLRDASAETRELASFHACAAQATLRIEEILDTLRPWSVETIAEVAAFLQELHALRLDPERVFVPPAAAPAPAVEAAGPAAAELEEAPLVVNLADTEMLREFIIESSEHLVQIENAVLRLEEGPHDPEILNAIFRSFHTFKGSAGFLSLDPVKHAAHELENLLDLARQGKLPVTTAVINLILEGADLLRQFVVEIQARVDKKKAPEPILISTAPLIARVRQAMAGEASAAPPPKKAAEAAPAAPAAMTAAPVPQERGRVSAVKVDVSKLDALFDLVGEMVVTHSLVAQDPDVRSLSAERLGRNLSQLSRITGELQKTAMSMRMVPIRATFQRMHRVVRDLGAQVGKRVELVLGGEETEFDRTIVEEIADPLLHMVRNSIDHGIEPAEDRVAMGKPAVGTISLRAFQRGGAIVIEIKDDGAGLNRARILKKAREKGLVADDAEPSDGEIFQLIFAPGFSTAAVVSDVSGRGVGMDVVRRNIEKLRGRIEIESVPGQGSTFTLLLPLTLAIIKGLVVRVGAQRYVIPALSVRESLRIPEEAISTLHERHEMVSLRGTLYPLLRLHELFSIPDAVTEATKGIAILIEAGPVKGCLLVDELQGKQEVVIKSLGPSLRHVRALAGAAILGDGSVGLILDPAVLLQPDREPVYV